MYDRRAFLFSLPALAAIRAKAQSVDEPLATFMGTVREVDKKNLTLEDADSNTMRFFLSRRTHFFDGSKKIQSSVIKTGDRVSIEAKRRLNGDLDAVTVRREAQKGS